MFSRFTYFCQLRLWLLKAERVIGWLSFQYGGSDILEPYVTIAQLVEYTAVNRSVAGSSPVCGVPNLG